MLQQDISAVFGLFEIRRRYGRRTGNRNVSRFLPVFKFARTRSDLEKSLKRVQKRHFFNSSNVEVLQVDTMGSKLRNFALRDLLDERERLPHIIAVQDADNGIPWRRGIFKQYYNVFFSLPPGESLLGKEDPAIPP